MSVERTFSIIKPDAVKRNLIGKVIERLEAGGLRIVGSRMIHMTRSQAEGFYSVHADKPFYTDLVTYMTSGPVIVQVLEGEDAIKRNREIMGSTNPKEAKPGTIRADFAESLEANSVHGSDAPETARDEILYFFEENEICPRAG